MKKIASILGLLSVSIFAHAQTPDDVELFSQSGLHGTPRFTAMGGAFTSLGNDMTALHLNPASIGVYRFSELSFSLAIKNENAALGSFYGTDAQTLNTNVLLDNIGMGLQFELGKNNKQFGFGLSFNKLADFDRSYSILGYNNQNTIVEFLGETSATYNTDDITDEAFAAYDAYLLLDTTIGNETYIRDSPEAYAYGVIENGQLVSSSDVRYNINQQGSLSETALTFGGTAKGNLHYGLSLGFPTLTFRREEFITEYINEQDQAPFNATQYTFRRLNDMYANGFNLKLGFIYAPIKQFRLGASYQSPTWYTVSQFYEFDFSARFNAPPYPGVSTSTQSATFDTDQYSYRLRTPAVWRVGISSVLNSSLIASIDYQYSNPEANNLYLNRSSYNISQPVLDSYQTAVQNLFTGNRHAVAAGLEYKVNNVFLRGGYRWDQSMYDSRLTDITASNRSTYSGGIGVKFGALSLDASYVNAQISRNYVTYTGYDINSGENVQVLDDLKTDLSVHNVVLGLTYKF